jgi:hypothetical protein
MGLAAVTLESAPRPFVDDVGMPYPLRKKSYERWAAKFEAWRAARDEWAELHGWPDGLPTKMREEADLMVDAPFDPKWEIANGNL